MQPHIKELVQHRFASHTVRMLLLVLSGRPIGTSQTLVQSKKKENIPQNTTSFTPTDETALSAVPESFSAEVSKILATVNDQFDAEELRAMAVHQIGSPKRRNGSERRTSANVDFTSERRLNAKLARLRRERRRLVKRPA